MISKGMRLAMLAIYYAGLLRGLSMKGHMQKLSCLHGRCVELTFRSNLLLLDGTARKLAWVKEIYWNGGKPSDLPYRDIHLNLYIRA